mgnify:CR=1 FL=1
MEAFTEVNEIFKLMPQELLEKIPTKFRQVIQEEMDKKYITDIKEPIEECELKDETIIILGLIYRDFLCTPEERKILQEQDTKQLQDMQKKLEMEMKEKYNPDNIFKNRQETKKEITKNSEEKSLTVISEEKWYQKIFNIIKRIFKKD